MKSIDKSIENGREMAKNIMLCTKGLTSKQQNTFYHTMLCYLICDDLQFRENLRLISNSVTKMPSDQKPVTPPNKELQYSPESISIVQYSDKFFLITGTSKEMADLFGKNGMGGSWRHYNYKGVKSGEKCWGFSAAKMARYDIANFVSSLKKNTDWQSLCATKLAEINKKPTQAKPNKKSASKSAAIVKIAEKLQKPTPSPFHICDFI